MGGDGGRRPKGQDFTGKPQWEASRQYETTSFALFMSSASSIWSQAELEGKTGWQARNTKSPVLLGGVLKDEDANRGGLVHLYEKPASLFKAQGY